MSRDWDGDPISTNYNRSGMKNTPLHSPHMGKKPQHKPHMGERGGAYVGDDE